MEKDLHELNVDGLNMKLTSEKLFVNSNTSNETFALRSVNGIGIVDLVEKYNHELSVWKRDTKIPWVSIILLAFTASYFLYFAFLETSFLLVPGTVLLGLAVYLYFKNSNLEKPTLKSAVRIMINGMSRDFEFDKKSVEANEVVKFVALIEDTLTSYHSNT